MIELFKTVTIYLSTAIEALAALVIAFASLQAAWHGFQILVSHPPRPEARKTEIRLQLGRWLSLAFEFLLAADILLTAIAPTWNEIAKLAAIATLRTLLNFFLEREISNAEARESAEARENKAQQQ